MSLLTDLQAEGLPVISVSPTGEVTMGPMTADQSRVYAAVIDRYYYPARYEASTLFDYVEVVELRVDYKNNLLQKTTDLLAFNNLPHTPSNAEMKHQIELLTTMLSDLIRMYHTTIMSQKE
jgi:hypothetical protein